MRPSRFGNVVIGLLMMASSVVQAQVTTATVYGNITDPTGAAIPSAPVTATNELTGATIVTQSNSAGEFTFTFLPVGRYTIAIEARGFKGQRRTGLDLVAGQSVRLNSTLELGPVSESVTISGRAPILDTASSEQQQTMSTMEVRELPLPKRDWTSLMNLGSGMVTGAATSGGVSLNGLPSVGFSFTVDGTDASGDSEYPAFSLYQNWNLIKGVSTEAIAEVSVTKGIASAEFANSLAGNVNVTTRSGTNESPRVTFPDNVRKLVQRRLRFGRFGAGPMRPQ